MNIRITDVGGNPDGKTDNTQALHAAIKRVESVGGGKVTFPPGTYLVTRDVYLPPDVELDCD